MSPQEAVGGALGIGEGGSGWINPDPKIGGDLGFFVGASIAIGVAAEPQGGRVAHENAVPCEGECARHVEAVEENGAAVHAPVAVGVGEHSDLTVGLVLALAVEVGHVGAHFSHPEPAVGCELGEHGVAHQGFGGHEFDPVPGHHLERGEFLFRGKGRGGRDPFGWDDRFLVLAFFVADLGKHGRG